MAAKRIFRYVKGALDFGILFPNDGSNKMSKMIGSSDSDWFRGKEDRVLLVIFSSWAKH